MVGAMNHLRFLRYVDEVARTGSIRQAAERLHVAASAVNRRILDLEDELGTPIFERLPRGMRLTAAGELFVHYIRQRAATLEQVRSEIEELQGLRRGRVRIVASQALAPVFLPQAIATFRRSHRLVDFDARVGDHLQALHALRHYETDLALVFNLAPEPDIERLAEFEQKLVATMHHTHPLAQAGGPIRLRDCVDHPVVLPYRDIGGRQLLERFLARSSVKLRPVVESNSFEFLRGCLYHEQAVSFQIAIGAVTDGGGTQTGADPGLAHRPGEPGHLGVKLGIAQLPAHLVLAAKDDGVRVVASLEQVLGEVEARTGEPAGARHALAVLQHDGAPGFGDHPGVVLEALPELLLVVDGEAVKRGEVGDGDVPVALDLLHELGQVGPEEARLARSPKRFGHGVAPGVSLSSDRVQYAKTVRSAQPGPAVKA